MRKRLMSGLLALLLVVEMCIPQVYAAEIPTQGNDVIAETTQSSEDEDSFFSTTEAIEDEIASTEASATTEIPEVVETQSELLDFEVNPTRIYSAVQLGEDTSSVSRIEWLRTLVSEFGMTVASDNYPDNYYADINASYEFYYDVMVATEFGLIDVDAGDSLKPDEPATREFAAHSLNICLGYVPDNSTYSFNEAESVNYPEDIEVAIEHCWFALEDGNFLPEKAITVSEKK